MLWVKAFHIIAMVAWFAGLFYLPRLFVYHALLDSTTDLKEYERFCTMESRLFWRIMTPSALMTIILGLALVHMMRFSLAALPSWLILKIMFVTLLIFYHIYCAKQIKKFQNHQNTCSATFFRWFNEVPALLLIAIVILVTVKINPF